MAAQPPQMQYPAPSVPETSAYPQQPGYPQGYPQQGYATPPPNQQPAQLYIPPAGDPKAAPQPMVVVQQQYVASAYPVVAFPSEDNTWTFRADVIKTNKLVMIRAIQFVLMIIVFICLCASAANSWISLYGSFGWFWCTFIMSILITTHILMYNVYGAYHNKVYYAFGEHSRNTYFYWAPVVYDCIAWIEWLSAAGSAASVASLCNAFGYGNLIAGCPAWSATTAFGFFVWLTYFATLYFQYVNRRRPQPVAGQPATMA
ncbi:hypothetical protein M427DRAFT_57430 [Gonapodya prolifera JEL478]|uniref:MARVEL domain-containing protein n=1 Tax=Gonapodya prolifera (strain JEL478) TaxID=1344416 RepID=A0A139ACH5_GONPJ|nr:hypothetical protein M427DRAFT_57430 [Gonapodya prolifera JEL478]|eukprot:KXS14516.1 hypothetical protein M427DRAFT_57430 [Gonapodya prolifera JEL478]